MICGAARQGEPVRSPAIPISTWSEAVARERHFWPPQAIATRHREFLELAALDGQFPGMYYPGRISISDNRIWKCS